MTVKPIGVVVAAPDSEAILVQIEELESMGIPAAWLTSSGAPDPITLFASAAMRTERIMFGTAIATTFPRHPVVYAQQAQVVAQLAPGRFRLGVGTSGRGGVESVYGIEYSAPLGHLREYLHILRALLQEGAVDFDGVYYKAHASITSSVDVPVMASALQKGSFELCGEEADGAISWVCPQVYLRDVAIPAMKDGAARAGRPVPALIAHVPVCVHDNAGEVREAVRQQFGFFARALYYQRMFVAAGFPEVAEGTWSDAMIDAAVLSGDESRVAERLGELSSIGATEILVSPVSAGSDPSASRDRTVKLLAQLST